MEGNNQQTHAPGELNGTKKTAPAKKGFLSGKLPIIIAIVGGIGCLGVIILIVIGIVAYKYVTSNNSESSYVDDETEIVVEDDSSSIQEGEYVWRGTIAGKDVYCEVYVNDWGTVHGGYHYGSSESDNLMTLDGVYDAESNTLTIIEYYDGNMTGQWNLKYVGNNEMTGEMTNYKGKTYPVELSMTQSF